MKSDKYWNGRFEQLKKSQLKRTDSFLDDMHDLNKRMKKDISDDVTLWYQRVATANGISMADAKKLMSKKDREEFQWTLEQYEQEAKASLLTGGFSNKVINASANWHLNYLESIDLQLEHHADKMFKGVHDKTTDFLKDSIKESYTETAFELQKGMGKGFTMEVPYDEHKLENILSSPWASDGKNFSSRIWKRKDKLVNELKKNLSESVIRGDSDTEAIKALSIDADKAEFNTRRIIETESAFFDSESERQCCEDFGIEKYRYLAVLDLKTSDICQELDNKVFLEKERQIGVNAPPMHPFCRSTTAPVIDEDFLTSRRAKNPKTGEYDEIPPEMNYKQWKEKYVEGKENVEEVKTNTPNGNSTNDSSSKQNQTIEEFDSKEFRKNYDNRVINKSTVAEPATLELDNPVSYGNTEKVYTEISLTSKEIQSEIEIPNEYFKKKVNLEKQTLSFVEHLEDLKLKGVIPKDFANDTKTLITNLQENSNFIQSFFEESQKFFISKKLHSWGIKQVLFKNTSLKFAKDLEYCLNNIKSVIPETLQYVRGAGDLNALINKVVNEDLKDDIKEYEKIVGKKPSEIWITNQIEQKRNYYYNEKYKITNSTLGIYLPKFEDEKFYGIYIFSDRIKDSDYTIKGAINHEIGHVIDDFLDISSLESVLKLFNETEGKGLNEGYISKNAYTNLKEFVAEAIREGLTNYDVEILFNKKKLENSNVKYPIKDIFIIIIDEYEKYKKNK